MTYTQEQINEMYQKAHDMRDVSSDLLSKITGAEIRYNKNPSEKNLQKLEALRVAQIEAFDAWHAYQSTLPKVKQYFLK